MANRYLFPIVTALTLLAAAAMASGQSMTPRFGIVPNGSYESYHVDAVNMDNGNDVIKIPLFSLPQLGKLALSFSIVSNTATWAPDSSCPSDGSGCTDYFYTFVDPIYGIDGAAGLGPAIVADNLPFVDMTSFNSNYCYVSNEGPGTPNVTICEPHNSSVWTVYDGTGGVHPLYYDATNIKNLRTTDGTGFLYESGLSNPERYGLGEAINYSGRTKLTDSHGVTNTWNNLFAFGAPQSFEQADPDGNKITRSNLGLTDTVGRFVPAIPQPIALNNSSGICPQINQALYQVPVSYADWHVPGPNNTTSTYRICYASFTIRTDFFNCPPPFTSRCNIYQATDQDGNPIYAMQWESYRTVSPIQSIVLPDGSYWGFLYDAADPNNSSDIGHYGTLSRLILPEGGSISYSYGAGWGRLCDTDGLGPFTVAGRTVSDGKGSTYQWTYRADLNSPGRNISTDPGGNDTVYQYNVWGCGNDLEASRKMYQGSSTNGNLLRTVATTYQTELAPGYGGPGTSHSSYGNALSQAVTTTLDTGLSTTITNGYSAATFSAAMPTCVYNADSGAYCQPLGFIPVNLSLGIPTSTSTTDYSSGAAASVLSSSTTEYAWQDLPGYLSNNLLDVPYISTRFDGAASQVAQTTFTPDEAPYTSVSNPIAGNPTSVLHWNNHGSPVVSHTAWTAKGMIDHAVDANGNTDAQYVYGPDPCSGFYPSGSQYSGLYPTAITNAFGQTTLYTWDCNTGQVASITDPNGVTTNYSYDSLRGRPTKIQTAVGTSTESWKVYQYPSPTEVDVFQDQNAKGDGLQRWVTRADGLGRVIYQQSPNGSEVDTQYDGTDQILSVSNPYLSPSDPTFGFTSFAYDALGRKTLACNPDNGTGSGPCVPGSSYHQWFYSGNKTTSYNEQRNSSQQFADALGRLTTVIEPGNLQTTYQYDALGNLWSVIQAGNGTTDTPRARSFTYDSLSRLLTSTNPETGTICYGIWSGSNCVNGYDANGNLQHETDASGTVVDYTYDALNRMLTKYSGLENTTNYSMTYDQGANGIGRLSSEQNIVANTIWFLSGTQFQYDPMGRVTSTMWGDYAAAQVNGNNPSIYWRQGLGAQYDLAGNIIQLTYPDGRVASQTWDSAGHLASVNAGPLGGGGAPYVSGMQYFASGALESATYGNGVSQTVSLNNRLQPCHEMASSSLFPSSPSGGNLMDRQLFYGSPLEANCTNGQANNGNIHTIFEGVGDTSSQSFAYDALNRLTQATSVNRPAATAYNQIFNYDSFGNMVLSDQLHAPPNYGIDAATNRLTLNGDVNSGDFRYYPNGALAMSPNGMGGYHTYTYTGEGYLRSIDQYGTGSYLYDSMGERTLAVHLGVTANEYVYLNGQPMADLAFPSGIWTDNIYANGQKIARIPSEETNIQVSADGGAGGYWQWYDTGIAHGYMIHPGDKLSWRQYQNASARGGMLVVTAEGGGTAWNNVDQNGNFSNQDSTTGVWESRIVDLSNLANQHINLMAVGLDQATGDNATIDYADISLISSDGTVQTIFNNQPIGLSAWPRNNTMANPQTSFPSQMLGNGSTATHYYLADQVGTTQMELAAGGWPVWQGYFTPFGQEIQNGGEQLIPGALNPDGTDNRYKFTAKERDQESGLDYMEARYYGSSMGRFMSPDPLGGHLENPQTLNRYVYAGNNPLSFSDPTGLDFYLQCQMASTSCQSQTVGFDKNGVAQTALVQGVTNSDKSFTATQIGNDANGGLVDKTTGTGSYSANVSGSGVQFSQDGGKTSVGGVFVNHDANSTSMDTTIQGSGALSGFNFTFTNSKMEASQTAAGTFTYNGSLDDARSAMGKAGFSYFPVGGNFGFDEYRSDGTRPDGANSGHFNIDRYKTIPMNGVPQVTGNMHFGEHNPLFSPAVHIFGEARQ